MLRISFKLISLLCLATNLSFYIVNSASAAGDEPEVVSHGTVFDDYIPRTVLGPDNLPKFNTAPYYEILAGNNMGDEAHFISLIQAHYKARQDAEYFKLLSKETDPQGPVSQNDLKNARIAENLAHQLIIKASFLHRDIIARASQSPRPVNRILNEHYSH